LSHANSALSANQGEEHPDGAQPPPALSALTAAAQLQHQLLDSYSDREAVQNEALTRALEQCASIKAAYRELYDKYRITTEVVEETMPKGNAAKLKPLEEQLKFAEVDVSVVLVVVIFLQQPPHLLLGGKLSSLDPPSLNLPIIFHFLSQLSESEAYLDEMEGKERYVRVILYTSHVFSLSAFLSIFFTGVKARC